ncbi:RTA1 like protein-domain-containing protein [Plectosphaerella plurivora]|uniref:RTA1 like protein-domain-containing protein n=1 Tax=Plectosphaerella plurivora TaxID=936078 RepID=A0A9P8VIU2_9PEZI|nr:RTA1 like protein-domain-containing protein [Plectosphaerella plurivora]
MSSPANESFYPSFQSCPDVSDICPIESTLYGDYFTTGACSAITFAYAVLVLSQAYYAGKGTSWTYTIWLGIGTLFELAGYSARIIMSYNPWIFEAFLIQNMTLMLGPTFTAAASSVTFKFLVMWYGEQWSLVRPTLVPYIFVGSDMVSILVQSAGGGLAAASSDGSNPSMANMANTLMIGGVAFQVVNMVACGGLMVLFWHRRRQGGMSGLSRIDSGTTRLWNHNTSEVNLVGGNVKSVSRGTPQEQKRMRIYVWSIAVAYIAILVRCIYRVPDMISGYGSDLQKNETLFLVLDGSMILISTAILTFVHPATFFPFMTRQAPKQVVEKAASLDPASYPPSSYEMSPMR